MPSVISHAVAAVALKGAFPEPAVPRRLILLGGVCSMAPDIDVIGFGFGIHYGDLLGHRGLTHSLAFAAALAFLATLAACPRPMRPVRRGLVWLYLFLATASHGLLDAMTDGGLGIAFFSPFSNARYFFSFRPICVCPIGGLSFFSARGLAVFQNEFLWIWVPTLVFFLTTIILRRIWRGQQPADPASPDSRGRPPVT
jgi:inner membrane protein